MKTFFYTKLAWTNIRKNYRFFVPRIITEAGLLASFYIVYTLARDPHLRQVRGGGVLPTFMMIGVIVILLLSTILMFYMNNFLMRQRKREFGIYNILGMEKKHIARIMLNESLIAAVLAQTSGIILGVLFYKVCSLLICKMLNTSGAGGFQYLSVSTILSSVIFYIVLNGVTYIFNLISIGLMKPVELLSSNRVGEKEPKVKWVLLVLGLVSLGSGYGIAVTTKSPLEAINLFFLAVLLVIAGTYFLFVAGSIFILKLLQKNKKYYYQKKHMPSVSGLLYRMKQNAVGLASICILATGVLVMISTTFCMYASMEDSLKKSFPEDYYVYCESKTGEDGVKVRDSEEMVTEALKEAAEQNGIMIRNIQKREYIGFGALYENGYFNLDQNGIDLSESVMGKLAMVYVMTEDTYRETFGADLGLKTGEAAVFTSGRKELQTSKISLADREYEIVTTIDQYPAQSENFSSIGFIGLVVSDDAEVAQIIQYQKKMYGEQASERTESYAVTFETTDVQSESYYAFDSRMTELLSDRMEPNTFATDAIWNARDNEYGLNGSLLFLGLLLGVVCLMATALIIYYKQISEGYEDRVRFQIMKKIGMSEQEIKGTIRNQVLCVFFLPILVAGIHTAFAFPLLTKLMHIFLMSDDSFYVMCALGVFLVFSLIYGLIYGVTSRTYYKIVN